MKKLTSNTFTKGLLKDFHPLTVPNDVMTDALNATIVTMNGNEGILQNDMGNGRVESAFLPAGYVPVGMKEYGGIIYVASYNPITNKGQIGSFPSPERNIDLSEISDILNPLELIQNNYIRTYKHLPFNNKDEYRRGLSLLTNKTDIFNDYIRAGDKFGLYFEDKNEQYDNNTSFLSNYCLYELVGDNRKELYDETNRVYRNNIITLSVLVLDANNNLRDITDLLKRCYTDEDGQNKIYDTSKISDKNDIFNLGYFIQNKYENEFDEVTTERNKLSVNTYMNKLYGKLFLVGTVNTIEYIDLAITYSKYTGGNIPLVPLRLKAIGEIDWEINPNDIINAFDNIGENAPLDMKPLEERININFFINYYYNCPSEYLELPKLVIDYPKDSSSDNRTVKYIDKNGNNVEESYDSITNLYRLRHKITLPIAVYLDEPILHYIVIPQMKNIPNESTNVSKLTHLAIEGSIDVSKIGQGFLGISTWKYRYVGNYMQLVWGLEDYPLETDVISNMRMIFYDWNSNQNLDESVWTYYIPDKISYNGLFTETLNLDNGTLKSRHIYIVKLVRSQNGVNDFLLGYKILITTPIYNDLFTLIDDYCNNDNLDMIQERNEINLELLLTEGNYTSSGIKTSEVDEELFKYVSDNWQKLSTSLLTMSETPDDNIYSVVKYYPITTTTQVTTSINIPSIYPFDLNNPGIIQYQLKIENNKETDSSLNKVGIDELPEVDIDIPGHDDNILINNQQLPQSGTSNQTFTGNATVTITNNYYFPSALRFLYSDLTKTFVGYTYEKIVEYAKSNLNDYIIFPIIATKGISGAKNDLEYVDLLVYLGGEDQAHEKVLSAASMKGIPHNEAGNFDDQYLIIYTKDNYCTTHTLSQFLSKISKYITDIITYGKTFVIVGSPLTFGWNRLHDNPNYDIPSSYDNMKHILTYELGYLPSMSLDINFFLKDKLSPRNHIFDDFDNIISLTNVYEYYWAVLLWKHKDGNYVVVNNIYYGKNNDRTFERYIDRSVYDNSKTPKQNCTDQKNAFIDNVFDKVNNIYYKTNNQDSVQGYPISSNGLTYNSNYNTTVKNKISPTNINISNYDSLLKYVDYTTSINFDDDSNNTKIIDDSITELDDLKLFLYFKVKTNSTQSNSTKERTFAIPGMDDKANQIVVTDTAVEGLLEGNIKDKNGNTLTDDFYLYENNVIYPTYEILNLEVRDFVDKLTIDNNENILIKNNLSLRTSNEYRLEAGNPPNDHHNDGGIIVNIGNYPSIDIPLKDNDVHYKKLFQ